MSHEQTLIERMILRVKNDFSRDVIRRFIEKIKSTEIMKRLGGRDQIEM